MKSNYKLTDKDYKNMAKLVDSSRRVANLYQELYELELLGRKESDDYKTKLDYLKMTLNADKKHYQSLSLDQYRLYAKALAKGMPKGLENKKLSGHFPELDRIISFLIIKTYYHPEFDAWASNQSEDTVMDRLYMSLEIERTNHFLIYLEEAMLDKSNQNLLPELLRKKYEVSYIVHTIEDELLLSGFEVRKFLTSDAKMTADMLEVDDNTFKAMKRDIGIEKAWISAMRLLSIKDYHHDDKKAMADLIIFKELTKSGLLFMDKADISEYKQKLEERFNVPGNEQTAMSQAVIMGLFEERINDLEQLELKLKNTTK